MQITELCFIQIENEIVSCCINSYVCLPWLYEILLEMQNLWVLLQSQDLQFNKIPGGVWESLLLKILQYSGEKLLLTSLKVCDYHLV
jgi:hypothetical protein